MTDLFSVKDFQGYDELKMSSREIAELTGKRHDHVFRDVKNLNVSYFKMALPSVGEREYSYGNNNKAKEFFLSKMQCFDLLTGYSTELRIIVNRRWEELENKNKLIIPQTLPEALRAFADEVEKNQALQIENKEMKPKAEFFNRVADSSSTIDMAKVATTLNIKGMGRNKLFEKLRELKILKADNTPYQEYVNRGYFKTIETETPAGIKVKTVVYQKGLDFIIKKLY